MLKVEVDELNETATVILTDAKRKNALNMEFWSEFPRIIERLSTVAENNPIKIKAIIIKGFGDGFSSGLNLASFGQYAVDNICSNKHSYQKKKALSCTIELMQSAFNALEQSSCIKIACIHGYCIGAAIELALACDLVYCTSSTTFCIKETILGIPADLGLLQRGAKKLVKNPPLFNQFVFTSEQFNAQEAFDIGLVAKVFQAESIGKSGEEIMFDFVQNQLINKQLKFIEKSTLLLVKRSLLYSRDHSVDDSLDWIKRMNSDHLIKTKDKRKKFERNSDLNEKSKL